MGSSRQLKSGRSRFAIKLRLDWPSPLQCPRSCGVAISQRNSRPASPGRSSRMNGRAAQTESANLGIGSVV